MGFMLPTLVVSVMAAFYFLDSGIPVPFSNRTVDVWASVIDDKPQPSRYLLLENFGLWFFTYLVAHLLMYVEPQRSFFHPFKLNSRYPSGALMLKEFFRSARGVLIGTLFEIAINRQFTSGSLPGLVPRVLEISPSGSISILTVVCGGLLLYVWGDAHFYWTHRMLHTSWFYQNVHKIHHESFNPDPWSVLSMHWFESSVYFSAAPMIAWFVPLWLFRLIIKGLILFPLDGHHGHGTWDFEWSHNHYIHHSNFNWNYGSSPLWDHIMGTNYLARGNKDRGTQLRARAAREQAELVGASIGDGFQACTVVGTQKKQA